MESSARPSYPSLSTLAMQPRPLFARPLTPSPSNSQSTESTVSTTSPQTPLGGHSFHSPGVMEREDELDVAGTRIAFEFKQPTLLPRTTTSTSPLPTPPSSTNPPTFTFDSSSPQPSMAAGGVAVLSSPPSLPSSPAPSSPSLARRRPPPPSLALKSPKKREHSLDEVPPRPKTPLTGSSVSSDASEVTEEKLERLGLAVRGNLKMRPLGHGHDLVEDIVDSLLSGLDSSAGKTFNHFGPLAPSPSPLPLSRDLLSPTSFLHKLSSTTSSPPLIIDLRPLGDFLSSRIPTSINIALPSLILKRAITGTWAGASWSSFSGFITTLDGQERWKEATGPGGLREAGREIVVLPGDRSGSGEGVRATFERLNRAAGREDGVVCVLDVGMRGLQSLPEDLLMQGERSLQEEDAVLGEHFRGASIPNSDPSSISSSPPLPPFVFSHGSPPPSRTRNGPSRSLTLPSSNHPGLNVKPLLSPAAIAHFSQLSPSFSSTSSPGSSPSSQGTSDPRRSKPPPLSLDTSTSPSHSLRPRNFSNSSSSDLSSSNSSLDTGKARPPKLSLRTLGTQPAGGPRTALSLDIEKASEGLQKKASRGLLIQTNLGDRRSSGQINGGGLGSGSDGSRTPSQSLLPPSFSQPQPLHSLCQLRTTMPPSSSSFSGMTGDLTRLQPSSSPPSSSYYGHPATPSTGSTFHASPSSSTDSSPISASGPEAFIVSTILPGFLYLGPDPTTEAEVRELEKLGIKRVLNMAVECEDEFGMSERFEVYRKVGIRDSVEEMGVAKGLKEGCAFLDDARLHSTPTYVHCRAGKSRSVTVVLAYLILSHRWSLKKAYAYVLERRKGISPNIGFMAELLNVEAELGRASSPGEGPSSTHTGGGGGHGRVRESLPPDWTLSSGLGEDDRGRRQEAGDAMGMGVGGEGTNDEMEVRRDGQFVHRSRPPVDTTTLHPTRRVSKAGLEGVAMNWESGASLGPTSRISPGSLDVDVEMRSPTSMRTPTTARGGTG